MTLARADAGLVRTYRFLVEEALGARRLTELLRDHAGASRPFSLPYPANRHMPLRTGVLIDFLIERLAAH